MRTVHPDIDRLNDFVDGALAPVEHAAVEVHVASCEQCGKDVAELRAVVTGAALLDDEIQPARDLWPHIAGAIRQSDAAGPRVAAAGARSPLWRYRSPLAAAAVLIILAASGGTALFMRMAAESEPRVATAAGRAAETPLAQAPESLAAEHAGTRRSQPTESLATQPDGSRTAQAGETGVADRPERGMAEPAEGPVTRLADDPRPAQAAAPGAQVVRVGFAAQSEYDTAIAELATVLERRAAELDPQTVEVVRRNLAIIDGAIREAHAALAADPGNGVLTHTVAAAYQTKVELLRRAVELPSRT